MTKKVAIIQELFSSYRGPIFDLLESKYDLIVIHGKPSSDLKLIDKPYSKVVPLKPALNGRFVVIKALQILKTFKPDIIIHQGSPKIISLPIVWFWCKFNSVKFVIWTHGYERHQGFKPYASPKSFLRLLYYKASDAILFYTKGRREFFKKYLKPSKLFYATNTLGTEPLLEIKKSLALKERSILQKELGMSNTFNLVFLGRLLEDKLPLDLLKVTLKLKERGYNVKTSIIGSGEILDDLKEFCHQNGLQNEVVFYGAIYDDEYSGKILYCSDLMVIPGYVGLAINHAYCYDLPLVTYRQGSNGPFHSPEIEYLEHGKTGLMIPPHDNTNMTECIGDLIDNKNKIEAFKSNVRDKFETSLKAEKMVHGFDECISNLIKE